MKISKITKEQEIKFAEIAARWVRRGLTVSQPSIEECKIIIQKLNIFLHRADTQTLVLDSPLGCWIGLSIRSQVRSQVESQVWTQVESQVRTQVESQVESQVWSQVESQVWSQVESQVRTQVESQVGSQVESQVWSQVESQVWTQVESQVGSQVWTQVRSQVESQVWSQVESQVWSQVESQVWSQVESQVRSQVESQVRSQVRSQVESQVWSQVESQVESQVRSQVESQVRTQVESQVGSQVESQVRSEFVWPYIDGHWSAQWFAWFEAMQFIGVQRLPLIEDYQNTMLVGLVYPLDGITICGRPPTAINQNMQGLLHSDTGPSVTYADGWSLWHLNGIAMEMEHVETPAERLSPEKVLAETNADRRRELIRKIGVERMLSKLPHRSVDKSGDYELLSVDLPGIASDVRYLKMLNPSIECWHLEAVDVRECPEPTVEAALNWRNSGWFTNAEILT